MHGKHILTYIKVSNGHLYIVHLGHIVSCAFNIHAILIATHSYCYTLIICGVTWGQHIVTIRYLTDIIIDLARWMETYSHDNYSISQEICTRFLLCCALLWLYIDWFSNDCPSASKATLMNMDKYFMWIHYERLHNHNKAKHNKTVCIFLGIYCNID